MGLRAGLNTYRYAASSPLRFIDRYGLVVTVTQQGNTINISGTIAIQGSAANPQLAQSWQAGVNGIWNPTERCVQFGRCTVNITLTFGVEGPAQNYVTVLPSGSTNPQIGTADWESVAGNQGYFYSGSGYSTTNPVAAHEVGHFMNAEDKYSGIPGGISTPYPGWQNSIMGQAGALTQNDIDEVLRKNGLDPCRSCGVCFGTCQ